MSMFRVVGGIRTANHCNRFTNRAITTAPEPQIFKVLQAKMPELFLQEKLGRLDFEIL